MNKKVLSIVIAVSALLIVVGIAIGASKLLKDEPADITPDVSSTTAGETFYFDFTETTVIGEMFGTQPTVSVPYTTNQQTAPTYAAASTALTAAPYITNAPATTAARPATTRPATTKPVTTRPVTTARPAATTASPATTTAVSTTVQETTTKPLTAAEKIKTGADAGGGLTLNVAKNGSVEFLGDDGNVKTTFVKSTGMYYSKEDAWKRNIGSLSGVDLQNGVMVTYCDTIKLNFTYEGDAWLVQLWKGQFGGYFLGAEVGFYVRPAGSTGYVEADASKCPTVTISLYKDSTSLARRTGVQGNWVSVYAPGSLAATEDRSGIKCTLTFNFSDEEMNKAFCSALENCADSNGSKLMYVGALDYITPERYTNSAKKAELVWKDMRTGNGTATA